MDSFFPTSFGLVDGTPVFMDVAQDSYFRLEHDEECAFLALLRQSERTSEPIVTGLVRSSAAEEYKIAPISCPPKPTSGLPGRPGKPKLSEMLAVGRLLLKARWALRTRSIDEILKRLVGQAFSPASSSADPIAAAGAFRSARNLVPLRGNCLSDSLALMHWLAKHRKSATLVFGVKVDPFAAHCWVQNGVIALNDHPERIERFTAVRIIECGTATP
jgi:hypothetical protein